MTYISIIKVTAPKDLSRSQEFKELNIKHTFFYSRNIYLNISKHLIGD